MSLLISHLAFSLLFAVVGLCAGWWLHARAVHGATAGRKPDTNLARDLLSSLHCLALRVAADVDEHNTRVGEVDRKLATEVSHEKSGVENLVVQLMKANEEVQNKLTQAEGKLEELSRKLESQSSEARTDALTGLPNRRAFEEESSRRLIEYQRSEQCFSLMMIDIDHFKLFNDEHGHQCGDEILRGVAQILHENMRGRDVVTRYGGKEFAVLMPTTHIGDARLAAETVREAIEKTRFQTGEKSLRLTISVGVAEVLPFEELRSLIKRSDQAMYAAKRGGRNRSYWHDGTLTHPIHVAGTQVPATDSPAETPKQAPRICPAVEPGGESSPDESSVATGDGGELLQPGDLDPDLLKDMGNKTMFCQDVHRRIAAWKRGGQPFSVILLSIDRHDELLSEYGDAGADLVVGVVARAIHAGLRDMDLVARYNGTTFGLVLPTATLRNAICVGERLRKAIGRTGVVVDENPVHFTVSLGIVEVAEGDEMATLVERGRAELGLASSGGGNRSEFAAGVPAAS